MYVETTNAAVLIHLCVHFFFFFLFVRTVCARAVSWYYTGIPHVVYNIYNRYWVVAHAYTDYMQWVFKGHVCTIYVHIILMDRKMKKKNDDYYLLLGRRL